MDPVGKFQTATQAGPVLSDQQPPTVCRPDGCCRGLRWHVPGQGNADRLALLVSRTEEELHLPAVPVELHRGQPLPVRRETTAHGWRLDKFYVLAVSVEDGQSDARKRKATPGLLLEQVLDEELRRLLLGFKQWGADRRA